MVLDKDLAKDIFQETFVRVFENRDRLLNSGSFRAWVFTIARNQCLNHLRRERRNLSLDSVDAAAMPSSEMPISALEKNEQIDRVNQYLARLKEDYREVVILREYQNLSYEEIAAITRSTLSAVKSRLFKARRRLAELMEADERREASRDRDSRRTGGPVVHER
jgi:RNA polymerase sigma-70 factor (ECF subfamily)